MTVEADLRLPPDLRDQGLHPGLRVGQDQGAGRVDHVDAFGARVDHDPGLPGQPGRVQPVGQHQEPDRLHAQVTRRGEVLDRHVRLGAVGGDPGHRRARLARLAQVLDGADAGEQQHRDPRGPRLVDGRPDQRDLVDQREAVVERRAAQPVTVRYLDDLHPGAVQGADHRPDLLLGELVPHRVRTVPQRGVGDADLARRGVHAATPAVASSSPTRAAAAVMMSRLPAHSGR